LCAEIIEFACHSGQLIEQKSKIANGGWSIIWSLISHISE